MVAPIQCAMEPTIKFSDNEKRRKAPPSNNKRARSLRFADSVDVHVIDNRDQLSQEEVQNCYLSKAELEEIRLNIRASLQKLLNGVTVDEDEELRGLESYAPNQYLARSERMRKAVRAVIKQQEIGKLEDRWLLYDYSALTEASTDSARARGMNYRQSDPASPPFQQIMVR